MFSRRQCRCFLLPPPQNLPEESFDRVVVLVGDAFFHWDDGVVGDVDVFGADFRAAFCDVAVADAALFFEEGRAVFGVEGVHVEGSGAHHEAWADEFVMLFVSA